MASFLMGIDWGNQGGVYEVPNNVATQNFQIGMFTQDNYRVTPKLTLNLGLRYELSLPRTERFNRMSEQLRDLIARESSVQDVTVTPTFPPSVFPPGAG